MKKNNKKCIVCSTTYTFCTHCSEFDSKPRWMALYHDENCKNIFTIASEYLEKKISKEEAKERFDACDLSAKENFHKQIQKVIDEVYDESKKVNKKQTKEFVNNQFVKNERLKNQ